MKTGECEEEGVGKPTNDDGDWEGSESELCSRRGVWGRTREEERRKE